MVCLGATDRFSIFIGWSPALLRPALDCRRAQERALHVQSRGSVNHGAARNQVPMRSLKHSFNPSLILFRIGLLAALPFWVAAAYIEVHRK